MAIYITGDTHASFKHRFSMDNFPIQKELTKNDYLIICGDFGGVWDIGSESKYETWWLDWFEEKNFTLLFVDGNHENFDRLYQYSEKVWHGGKVHVIRPNIMHLMRGQVYEIDGKRVFSFGGASSHDVSGGILDKNTPDFIRKKQYLEHNCIPYRINHISWWEQELPSESEMEEGTSNLLKINNTVDIIISHCCSSSTQKIIDPDNMYKEDRLTDYLDFIKHNVQYKKWYFGHYHDDKEINCKETMLYTKITRIDI